MKRFSRRILVAKGLHFEYVVSPHRAFLAKVRVSDTATARSESQGLPSAGQARTGPSSNMWETPKPSTVATSKRVGVFLPFKQSRLKGQVNPLRPPLHVETVLIGRALGQPTGYLHGVGFRIRDDGYVEAEFEDGVKKFGSHKEFKSEIARRLKNQAQWEQSAATTSAGGGTDERS